MANRRRAQKGKHTEVGTIMARQAWEGKVASMRDGNTGPRVWTQANGRAKNNKAACRGKVAWS